MMVEIIGPFSHHSVVINGYEVPHLTAHPVNGGVVTLILDGRMSLEVSVEQFDAYVAFIADAIAVAGGFTCHPSREFDEPLVHRTAYHRLTGF